MRGRMAAAHVRGERSSEVAAEAGVDSLEHATYANDRTLRLIRDKGLVLVPGLRYLHSIVENGPRFGITEEVIGGSGLRDEIKQAADTYRRARDLGIHMCPGGDFGFAWCPHGEYAKDIQVFVDVIGYSPVEAIRCATLWGAELMRMQDRIGSARARQAGGPRRRRRRPDPGHRRAPGPRAPVRDEGRGLGDGRLRRPARPVAADHRIRAPRRSRSGSTVDARRRGARPPRCREPRGEAPPAPEPRRLSVVVTALSALVLLALVALTTWLHQGSSVESVSEPEAALGRVVGRDLDLEAGLAHAMPWERRLYVWLMLETSDGVAQATEWYEELEAVLGAADVALRLAVLHGETGRLDDVRDAVADWNSRSAPFPLMAETVSAAYLGERVSAADAREMRVAIAELLEEDDWFLDRLTIALARGAGDAALHGDAEASLSARARGMLGRARALVITDLAIVVVGGAGLVVALRRLRRDPASLRVAGAQVPPPWPTGVAVAVLLRGGAAGALVLAAFLLIDVPDGVARVGTSLAANVAVVPLLLLVRRHLLRPAGQSWGDALGIWPAPGSAPRLLIVTVALVGAGALGDWAGALLGGLGGWTSHWTEWFDGDLIWGDASVVGITLIDACVAAPALEEVAFRGLLFGALRTRLSLPVAALASAGLFAVAHGYGAIGFASVLWSGLVWAWAYERTGSLLPGMAAHAVNNVAASLAVMALYR